MRKTLKNISLVSVGLVAGVLATLLARHAAPSPTEDMDR